MAKKAKKEVKKPGAPFWMVTYSDMVTLLMVFFIMILSYSTIQLEKFRGAMSSMKGALGILDNMKNTVTSQPRRSSEGPNQYREKLERKIEEIRSVLALVNKEAVVLVELDGLGIHIRLGNNILFESGKADLRPAAFPILKSIAKLVRDDFKEVYVEGHTDNLPIHTARFPSNWELSAARALSVVRYLHYVEGIDAARLAAVGFGEYRPLVPNTSPRNRALNRRVEIYIRFEEI